MVCDNTFATHSAFPSFPTSFTQTQTSLYENQRFIAIIKGLPFNSSIYSSQSNILTVCLFQSHPPIMPTSLLILGNLTMLFHLHKLYSIC
jgi:hypothetical protein